MHHPLPFFIPNVHTNQRTRFISSTGEIALPWANMAADCASSIFGISMACSTPMLIGDTINEMGNFLNGTENLLKIPSRVDADLLAIYKT